MCVMGGVYRLWVVLYMLIVRGDGWCDVYVCMAGSVCVCGVMWCCVVIV